MPNTADHSIEDSESGDGRNMITIPNSADHKHDGFPASKIDLLGPFQY
jgi:hypothetical protein